MRIFCSILLVLLLVPQWAGDPRLPLLGTDTRIDAEPVALDARDPARRRVGDLVYLGGVALHGRGEAFGGFSSLAIGGGRITLLSDGGNVVSFALRHGQPQDVRFAELPAGPGTGWDKADRDSESMTVDRASGRIWVGFENSNAIYRYAPDFARAEAAAIAPAMAHWPENKGPEAMTLTPDGGMIVIAETTPFLKHKGEQGGRMALRFAGDPTQQPRRLFRFGYMPPAGYDPSDMTVLPDGRLLVLNRRFALPFDFTAVLTMVDPRAIRPGAMVAGREIARFEAPLLHDNFEGVAVTQEAGATIIWLVADDNQLILQRSLLLKFRLDPAAGLTQAGVLRRRPERWPIAQVPPPLRPPPEHDSGQSRRPKNRVRLPRRRPAS